MGGIANLRRLMSGDVSRFLEYPNLITISILYINNGHAVAQLAEALRRKPECRGFDSRWGSVEFFIDIILWHYGPGVDQEVKAAGRS
jgi:hypothetical protein